MDILRESAGYGKKGRKLEKQRGKKWAINDPPEVLGQSQRRNDNNDE
jgi:hypothetical protein